MERQYSSDLFLAWSKITGIVYGCSLLIEFSVHVLAEITEMERHKSDQKTV